MSGTVVVALRAEGADVEAVGDDLEL